MNTAVSTGTQSTQAYLNYSYQYQSVRLMTVDRPDALKSADGDRDDRGRGSRKAQHCECEDGAPTIDMLDLGNSRGLQPSAETVLSMLEEKVNARVEASFKTEDAQPAEKSDYWSAEKTGERIARFALKFYDRYAEKNGESEETLTAFMNYITGAIDEGFGQATRQIAEMSGGEMPGEKKSLVDATHDRVMSILEEFRQSVLDRIQGGKKAEEGASDDSGNGVPQEI